MKHQRLTGLFSLLLFVVLVAGSAGTAMAGGTTAGTNILNRATVNYNIGTVSQPLIESSPTGNSTPGATNGTDTDFLVDNLVDLSVSTLDGAPVTVIPGSNFAAGQYNILKFRVQNDGNKVQDFGLDVVTVASTTGAKFNGDDDNADMDATIRIFVNSVVNEAASTYALATDTATYIDELAPDSFFDVFVIIDAPAGLTDGDIASYHLVATTKNGGLAATEGAVTVETGDNTVLWAEDTEQIIFGDGNFNGITDPNTGSVNPIADAANDGKNSDQDDYIAGSANMSVAKTVTVFWDPILGFTNPKAIPGAILIYTITVTNAGSSNAVNVDITDSLDTEITAGTLNFVTRYDEDNTGLFTCAVGQGMYVNGSCHTNLSDSPVDESEFVAGTNIVTVNDLTVNSGGGTAVVKFQVEITP